MKTTFAFFAGTFALITFLSAHPGHDSPDEFQPNIVPQLHVTKLTSPIIVDADLEDEGWFEAAAATNFTEHYPNPLTAPPIDMETMIAYDDDYLYLAFIVYDDPDMVRASMSDRDEMWNDDYVGIFDQAWHVVEANYVRDNFNGVDWVAVYEEYLPFAE